MATDIVSVGGLSVSNQSFFAINTISTTTTADVNGFIGLGFPDNAAFGAVPWFINLANQGSLASNVFSFYLTDDGAKGSELCVGCIDSTKFLGEPEYFPVIPVNGTQKWWSIQVRTEHPGASCVERLLIFPFKHQLSRVLDSPSTTSRCLSPL